jgi:hypothetical protein
MKGSVTQASIESAESINITATAAANAAVASTIAAAANQAWVITRIQVSFTAAPAAAAALTVSFGGVNKFDIDLSAAGPYDFQFPSGLHGKTQNQAMVVTLAAGGAGVIGTINYGYV